MFSVEHPGLDSSEPRPSTDEVSLASVSKSLRAPSNTVDSFKFEYFKIIDGRAFAASLVKRLNVSGRILSVVK